ncbi:37646_t:CDS:2, partial [Gigaspora margarita]
MEKTIREPGNRPEIKEVYESIFSNENITYDISNHKSIRQEEIISGEKWKDSSQNYISDTDIGQTTFNEK